MPWLLLITLVLPLSAVDFHLKAEAVPQQQRGVRLQAEGARLQDESVQSAALGRVMKYRVLLPADYRTSQRRYPVLYLLHGLDGDHTDWTTRTNLAEYTRALPLIIVMPNGNNSWYTDSPEGNFETYLTTDLPADVVHKFRTINSRYGRAIAGLSMGGYGAIKTALKQPAAFTAAASFSGALNVTRNGELEGLISKTEAERLEKIFGPSDSETRHSNDVFALAAALKPGTAPYIYLDCGIADTRLIGSNRELVAAIHKTGVAYEYHEIPGGHSWDYWDRRIREFLPILMKRLANQ